MKQLARDLLAGAFDLHTHGFPEIHPGFGMAQDDVEMAEYAARCGLHGYILKSHVWPTIDRVYHLREQDPGIQVYSSITLNTVVGGCSPGVVETAVRQGVKAVWMPTWSAANDLARDGFSRLIRRELPGLLSTAGAGITIAGTTGRLRGEAADVLRVAADADIILATGHVSPAETLALAREADRIGYRKLVFTHPDGRSVGASDEEIEEAARLGAHIEWTFGGMLPHIQRIRPQDVARWIDRVGACQCLLTTDTFGRGSLAMPDLLKLYLGELLDCGVDAGTLRTILIDNARRLLGLPATETIAGEGTTK